MYTYINAISISIFIMALYILYASWSIDKTNKNTILLSIIGIVIISKVLYLTMDGDFINLEYIYKTFIILLIIKLNIKLYQNKIVKVLINVSYILGLISLTISLFRGVDIYNVIIIGCMLITTLFLSFISIYNKKINKYSLILINLTYISIFITPFTSGIKMFDIMKNILDCVSSIYIFNKVFNSNTIYIKGKKEKIKDELNKTNLDMKIHYEQLNINKNITNMISNKVIKKQELLQMIEGYQNRCTFIIDNEGYILNEDNGFSKVWSEYAKNKYKIKLSDFLEDNIKNSNDFIESINKVNKKSIEVYGELKSKDGKFFSCTYAPFKINNQNIGVICSVMDTTYKKNTEIKIKDNNTKYKKIVDNIPYSILLTDENDILYNNNKNQEIDFNKDTIKEIIIKESTSGEVYYHKDNKEMYFNINRINFEDGEGKKNLVVVRDITDYKMLLKEVEYSKIKYESLVNIIPEGIYVSNYENKEVNYSNNVFSELVDSKTLLEINDNYKNEAESISLISENEEVNFERKVINNKYGQEVNIEFGKMLIEVNKKLKIVGIVRDITEQVKAENIESEIEAKKKENKIKTEFFINMSHELKTPLNVISSSNQLLETMNNDYILKNPKSEISKATAIVKKHTYMLMGLINNIIDLAKLESQFYEFNMDYYNIVSVVEDVCDEFNKYIKVNNIEILFDTDEEERIANIDPYDIEKIVLTLLSMVVRYSYPETTINVDLSSYGKTTTITIKNESRYDYNRYINDQERRSLDIGIAVAKSMIELYKGNIDIKIGSKKDIEISINIEVDEEISSYKKRRKSSGDEFIYTEYLRMCNF